MQAVHLRRAAQRAFASGDLTTAEGFYRRLLAEPFATPDPCDATGDRVGLATVLRVARDAHQSEPMFQTVLRAGPVCLRADVPALMGHEVGVLLVQIGRRSEARPILEAALSTARLSADFDVTRLSVALAYLASEDHRPDAATAHAEEALAVSARLFGVDHPEHAGALTVSARAHRERGRRATADRLIELAYDTVDRAAPTAERVAGVLAFVLLELAESRFEQGRLDDAIGPAAKAVSVLERSIFGHPALLHPLRTRSRVLRALGHAWAAGADEARSAAIVRAWSPPLEG